MDNDVDFAVDLLNDALGEFSSHVDTMREAVAGKKDDWPLKVRIASHSIKGVAGNLSMERVHKSSAALETWGREREGKASAALVWYQKAADQGLPSAIFALGQLWYTGFHNDAGRFVRDVEKALGYFEKSADAGFTPAAKFVERAKCEV